MRYFETCIVTVPEGLDDLCARLIALDVPGFQVDDEEEFRTFLEQSRPYWDYVDDELVREMEGKCQVKIYLPEDQQGEALLSRVRRELPLLRQARPDVNFGSLEMTTVIRDEADWQDAWKQYYKPIAVGKRLLIVPEWESAENPQNRIIFRSNPGMAFGTGTHASTRLCLELLEPLAEECHRLLDLGCGSGILAIAALLLGAEQALGIDIDQGAVKIAGENAALNGVSARFDGRWGNVLEDKRLIAELKETPFELVTANIVADVIIALAPVVPELLCPGGTLIASGIIDQREEEVVGAVQAAGFSVKEIRREGGWCALRAVKERQR